MNPSAEWTLEERLLLIGALALRMQEAVRDGTPRGDLYEHAERIRMVATMLPMVLEASRQAILQEI